MHPFEVLLKPIISEKSNQVREDVGQYTFEVNVAATKKDIRNALAKVFEVKATKIRTLVCRGKVKRRGTHVTKLKKTKKAIVKLAGGQTIKLFDEQ